MICFPNAKINLGLYITEKRQDGYHNIESCLYPIPLRDALEIIPAPSFSFHQTGIPIPDDTENNLCVKAYRLIKERHHIDPVAIHLHKVIPMGAGLGGGSSNCAFTLKALNDIFSLGLGVGQLEAYAAELGSDCPFFIKNIPTLASGTGIDLTPIDLDLSKYYIGLIFPGVHIGTGEAYSGLVPQKPASDLKYTLQSALSTWQNTLFNDFQLSAQLHHKSVKSALAKMDNLGATYYSMTGSGSAVFGLFDTLEAKNEVDFFATLNLDF